MLSNGEMLMSNIDFLFFVYFFLNNGVARNRELIRHKEDTVGPIRQKKSPRLLEPGGNACPLGNLIQMYFDINTTDH